MSAYMLLWTPSKKCNLGLKVNIKKKMCMKYHIFTKYRKPLPSKE